MLPTTWGAGTGGTEWGQHRRAGGRGHGRDAAYGDGGTRQTFADAGRTLIIRVPGRPNRTHFPKEDFLIDLEAGTCTCPAGQVTRIIRPSGTRTGPTVELIE